MYERRNITSRVVEWRSLCGARTARRCWPIAARHGKDQTGQGRDSVWPAFGRVGLINVESDGWFG